jgi:hypothetical protein
MVIFGWRQTAKELAAMMMQCRRCGMPGWQHVVRTITWFTLFFLPVLPLWFSWKAICGTCGNKQKISKGDADQMVAQARTHAR